MTTTPQRRDADQQGTGPSASRSSTSPRRARRTTGSRAARSRWPRCPSGRRAAGVILGDELVTRSPLTLDGTLLRGAHLRAGRPRGPHRLRVRADLRQPLRARPARDGARRVVPASARDVLPGEPEPLRVPRRGQGPAGRALRPARAPRREGREGRPLPPGRGGMGRRPRRRGRGGLRHARAPSPRPRAPPAVRAARRCPSATRRGRSAISPGRGASCPGWG